MEKPNKPRNDYPLYAHASGKWAKTINGRKHYFGRWDDPIAAEREFIQFMSGEDEPTPDVVTVVDACDALMREKTARLKSDELSQRQFDDLMNACKLAIEHVGRYKRVDALMPKDFEPLLTELRRRFKSPKSLKSRITTIRSIFNFAYNHGLIEKQVPFGSFRSPKASTIRRYVAEQKRIHGPKLFTWVELALLLNAARPIIRAMILLGINCGFNPADIKTLRRTDIRGAWMEYYRRKAATERRCYLWPETIAALGQTDSQKDLMFITQQGNSWGDVSTTDCPVSKEFRKLLGSVGLYRRGHSFGTLRSTYLTWADESKDAPAVNLTMGHVDAHMSAQYRQHISNERLVAVSDIVRNRLFT